MHRPRPEPSTATTLPSDLTKVKAAIDALGELMTTTAPPISGRPAGIVSIGDVVKYRLAEMAFELTALRAVHRDGVRDYLLNLHGPGISR